MAPLGRFLQLAGLILLPLGILLELEHAVTLWQCLTIAAFGAALFALGYLLQGFQAR